MKTSIGTIIFGSVFLLLMFFGLFFEFTIKDAVDRTNTNDFMSIETYHSICSLQEDLREILEIEIPQENVIITKERLTYICRLK